MVTKPMRIAILTTDNREGIRDYTRQEPILGHAPEALLQGLVAMPDVEVHLVACLKQPVNSPEKIAPNIFYHSLIVPKIGWLRTGYQGCIRAVRKKLKEIQPDIVHGQGTERDCALSAVFSGFPNVLTLHGNMTAIAEVYHAPPGSFHWLAARLETVALKKTGGVFCNSAYTERLVTPRTQKTWRVPNALRLDFFAPPPKKNPGGAPILLSVGVTEPRKQQLELIEVAHRLHQRGLKLELHIAGDRAAHTDYGEKFSRALAAAERAGYARHLGQLSTSLLVTTMDAAGALIHFPTEEAFGLVVAEALARNLKFFGAATGGVGDIAAGVAGTELFPPQDFTALENAIARWLEAGCPPPPDSAAIMRERYHPTIIAQRHIEIYRGIISRGGKF